MIRSRLGQCPELDISIVDVRRQAPPEPNTVDGVIITGSAHSVCERLTWMQNLEAFIRTAVAEQRYVLGLCFGHQIMASALGGAVSPNLRGKEFGMVTAYPVEPDPSLRLPLQPFPVYMAHQDTVSRLPPGAAILARTARDAHAAIRFAPRAWGMQFHPEFSREVIREYVEANATALIEQGDNPGELARTLEPTPLATELLRQFRQIVCGASRRDGKSGEL